MFLPDTWWMRSLFSTTSFSVTCACSSFCRGVSSTGLMQDTSFSLIHGGKNWQRHSLLFAFSFSVTRACSLFCRGASYTGLMRDTSFSLIPQDAILSIKFAVKRMRSLGMVEFKENFFAKRASGVLSPSLSNAFKMCVCDAKSTCVSSHLFQWRTPIRSFRKILSVSLGTLFIQWQKVVQCLSALIPVSASSSWCLCIHLIMGSEVAVGTW